MYMHMYIYIYVYILFIYYTHTHTHTHMNIYIYIYIYIDIYIIINASMLCFCCISHRHMVNCYHFNISKIIFLTLSDARMCVPVYILFSLARSSTGVAWDSLLLCSLNRKAAASRALRNPRIIVQCPRFAHSFNLF